MYHKEEIGSKHARELIEMLLRIYSPDSMRKCIPERLSEICGLFPDICLIVSTGDIHEIRGISRRAVYMGRTVGIVIRGTPYPYPAFLQSIYRCTGDIRAAIEAHPQGVRAFLYGNDILVASVKRIYRDFRAGDIVGVIDSEDGSVIGIGRASMTPEDLEEAISRRENTRVAVENIFDLGWFFRILKPVEE